MFWRQRKPWFSVGLPEASSSEMWVLRERLEPWVASGWAKVTVVGDVEDDGEDVVLADAHGGLEAVVLLGEDAGLDDLRGEVPGVGGEVAQEAFEAGGGDSGGEGAAAPVVEEGSGDGGRGELLDDEVAAAEAGVVGGGEEGDGGTVLVGKAGSDGGDVGIEDGDCGGRLGG